MSLPFPPNEWQWRDRNNVVMPWFTRPMLDVLEAAARWPVDVPNPHFSLGGSRVFEWGMGYSTLWWAEYAAWIDAVDSNEEWVRTIRVEDGRITNGQTRLMYGSIDISRHEGTKGRLRHCTGEAYESAIDGRGFYDIIVIDGERRYECALKAMAHIQPGGIIILDNSEENPAIHELFRFNVSHTFPQPGHPHWCTTYWKITQFGAPPASAEIATAEHKQRRLAEGGWG